MEAYNTKIKVEHRRQQLIERRARLRILLSTERKQFEVYAIVYTVLLACVWSPKWTVKLTSAYCML